jgi:TRAP-type C4-dicarboxylate transport system permease small subunit
MSYVSYEKKHITVDLLTWRFAESGSFSRYTGLVSSFITIAVCLAYGYLGFEYCITVASMGQRTIDIGYPRIILVSSIAFGFTLMTLYTVLHLVAEIRAFKNPETRRTS